MKAIITQGMVIITYKNIVLVKAKGDKRDVRRLMLIAQENLQSLAA
jgi:hypothetical protein